MTKLFNEALKKYYGEERLRKLQSVKVGICGVGGLGSNCAMHLVRSGITKLRIIDFDRVEWTNLNRQFFFPDQLGRLKVEALRENLLYINPETDIEIVSERLTSKNAVTLLEGCDIIVEAFDRAENKADLVSNLLPDGRPLVACSGIAGYGRSDRIKVRKVRPNLVLVGDMESDISDAPPYSAMVGIAAAKEADAVIEYILDSVPVIRKLPNTDLYCITDSAHSLGRSNVEVVAEMLKAGVKIIQYREKDNGISAKQMYYECCKIRRLTADSGCCLIIDDYTDLALAVGADGVHIGQDDMPIEAVRSVLGDEMIIGLSTHSPEQMADAIQRHADYIGVGPIYRTFTKKNVCSPVGLEYLEYAVKNAGVPYVAIGGIKEHNIAEVASRGAKMLCLVTEITAAENIPAKIETLRCAANEARKKYNGG